jgi:hypothetical protein
VTAACTKAITVTETRQMNYGTLFVTSGGGTAKIAANGVVTAPAGFVLSGATAAGALRSPARTTARCTLTFDVVGADLVINAGQAGGNYSGAYTGTVILAQQSGRSRRDRASGRYKY